MALFNSPLCQGSQVGGTTAQNLIWGSLRIWWALKKICPTAHKIWQFGAVSENFEVLCSKNVKILSKTVQYLRKELLYFFPKSKPTLKRPNMQYFFTFLGWAEFGSENFPTKRNLTF